jgi:serine/threonine protein phosphatase PrpC
MSKVTSSAQHRGQRPYQEDTRIAIVAPEGLILAVADGHGGDEVSKLIEKQLPGLWRKHFNTQESVNQIFKNIYFELATMTAMEEEGSTLSIAFIPEALDVVHVAILGDSPVLVNQPDDTLWVSPEHNVRSNLAEQQAAIARGGIMYNGYVWNDSPVSDHAHGLQMSRAFGDLPLARILSREPEYVKVPLGGWVLVASDGLVDPGHGEGEGSCSPETIAEMIDGGNDAEELVQYAIGVPTGDNVTALLWRRG